ncbi:hypothetical protein HK101_011668 [Irineochytrium annulatum]|nr:hypothetical protein HK101_011668 [Irineochytrium annulatum]
MRAIDGGVISFADLEMLRNLWDSCNQNELTFMTQHADAVNAILFHAPDRARIVTACLRAAKIVLAVDVMNLKAKYVNNGGSKG